MRPASFYVFKSKKKKFKSAYQYLKNGERVFTLTSSTDKKDVSKFSSQKAALAAGWVRLK